MDTDIRLEAYNRIVSHLDAILVDLQRLRVFLRAESLVDATALDTRIAFLILTRNRYAVLAGVPQV